MTTSNDMAVKERQRFSAAVNVGRVDMSHQTRRDGQHTEPAGQGISDDEMARQVTDQTSGDRIAKTFFEGERRGARSEEEAAKFRDDHRKGARRQTSGV